MSELSREEQARRWWRPQPHWPADCPCEECSPNSWRNVHGRALEAALSSAEKRAADAERERDRLKEREEHFAKALRVADGGQYRADWDGAISRVLDNLRSARASSERAKAKAAELSQRLWLAVGPMEEEKRLAILRSVGQELQALAAFDSGDQPGGSGGGRG